MNKIPKTTAQQREEYYKERKEYRQEQAKRELERYYSKKLYQFITGEQTW